jgi:branched-chain amino acid transport system ATP-binding protein
MTVLDNLLLGACRSGAWETHRAILTVHDVFPRLVERAGQLTGNLSGGEQQMPAIRRALRAQPKLLLDEPSLEPAQGLAG